MYLLRIKKIVDTLLMEFIPYQYAFFITLYNFIKNMTFINLEILLT